MRRKAASVAATSRSSALQRRGQRPGSPTAAYAHSAVVSARHGLPTPVPARPSTNRASGAWLSAAARTFSAFKIMPGTAVVRGVQLSSSRRRVAESYLSRNDLSLDLVGTFSEGVESGIPPITLHRAFRRVSGAREDLHAMLCAARRHRQRLKSGFRFSKNAAAPSCCSPVE